MARQQLVGPFKQILTIDGLNSVGAVNDDTLEIIADGGILLEEDKIVKTGNFNLLKKNIKNNETEIFFIPEEMVLLPGLIDAHTHLCFAGNRARDYILRSAGKSYKEIAATGGGIMTTVLATRKASPDKLIEGLTTRCARLLSDGITTCEVKSGYGLTVKDELKMLQAINQANNQLEIDLIATALPAHICPPEYANPEKYLSMMIKELLPEIISQKLAERVDIFIDENGFSPATAIPYLNKAHELGFDLTIHGDQFTVGGSALAARYNAVSCDHLEVSGAAEIMLLVEKNISGTLLPGASIGLGVPFAPARKMLDAGMKIVIASDWNPGSAPMGDLLIQASLLGIYEKLSCAEILRAMTVNAAQVLRIPDRGILKKGFKADMIAFPCSAYGEIFYRQGKLKPTHVWKNGRKVK